MKGMKEGGSSVGTETEKESKVDADKNTESEVATEERKPKPSSSPKHTLSRPLSAPPHPCSHLA